MLGATDGERVEVSSGLVPGDRIVVDGADKLRDGAKINMRTETDTSGTQPPDKSGGKKKQRSENGQEQ
jgi:membrane fusion protein, multidrug efflux system